MNFNKEPFGEHSKSLIESNFVYNDINKNASPPDLEFEWITDAGEDMVDIYDNYLASEEPI